jgi:predicted phosphodiesterase
VSPRRVREAAERLGVAGFRVGEDSGRIVLQRVPPPSATVHRALFSGEVIRFGVLGDTHLGSKHERLEELHIAYDRLTAEGIERVFHVGDLVCGLGIYPGQANDIHQHTYEDQVAYAVANYPRRKPIRTHLIAGNHDLEGEFGKVGADPVAAACNQRDDMAYLGAYATTIELEQGTRIYLLHPKGAMGYAADYKIRKIAESFEGGEKPNAMFVGHYHRRGDFEARGIQCVLTGCFESGQSYGARLGLAEPAVGFHLIEATIGEDGSIVRWRAEWFRFWRGRMVASAA